MRNMKRKQQGVAGIIFVLLLLGMIGFLALATDGARALQTRARLDNASEVASIAVAALNDDNESTDGSGSAVNQTLVSNYAKAYVPDINNINSLKISKVDCSLDNSKCLDDFVDGYQYQINISTDQLSWFPGGDNQQGFGKTFTTASQAISQKVESPVDTVIVADFSGSMNNRPSSGGKAKYKQLQDVVQEVTDQLATQNANLADEYKNKIGLAVYNTATHSVPSDGQSYHSIVQTINNNGHPTSSHSNVDATNTIQHIFDVKNSSYEVSNSGGNFHDLQLTTDFNSFNSSLDSFYPSNGTASYQGIIRGAQLLNTGTLSRRLMIIISDGEDNYPSTTQNLVDNGMCDTIRDTLDSQTATVNGQPVETTLAFIGFDYDTSTNPALTQCVGKNNVYEAKDGQQMVNQILGIINEETGHLR
ncbi:hypothetical protein VMF7928_00894 [Vibrio marisflavi CECT 7928]|uniref:VWFA domain-containing protein n=2 Tax=Vibrio marisflavi TaxID=1216040 RepID=A0ABN8E437_9VIBR|nr:hypothetical protein VMF7928_00894 [Vibrio marisflavi CECT 7928]